jgi:fused signal recognition particle receptor
MSGNEEKEKKKGMFGRLFGGAKDKEIVDVPVAVNEGEESNAPTDKTIVLEVNENVASSQSSEPVEVVNEAVIEPEAQPEKKGWFSRLTSGLAKSSSKLTEGITSIFTKTKLDDEALQDLEDLLIQSDLGVATAMRITDQLSASRYDKEITGEEVKEILAQEVSMILEPVAQPLVVEGTNKPHILLMVGVNGAGKTTSIGKLALKFKNEGKSVMLAAGDTFRAAAVDQLKVWGERTGAGFVSGKIGADASGLVYDALEQAKEEGTDVLMIDTAGRLQNKADLMAELEKIVRVIKKFDPTGPHNVLLTLDATTGQNALNQVEIFQKIAGVTGLIMTKLDGTARGGILVAIAEKYKLPIHAIGVGETIEDMQPFDPNDFAKAIAGVAQDH